MGQFFILCLSRRFSDFILFHPIIFWRLEEFEIWATGQMGRRTLSLQFTSSIWFQSCRRDWIDSSQITTFLRTTNPSVSFLPREALAVTSSGSSSASTCFNNDTRHSHLDFDLQHRPSYLAQTIWRVQLQKASARPKVCHTNPSKHMNH